MSTQAMRTTVLLAIALLGSWAIGITVTPAFCYWFLPKQAVSRSPSSPGTRRPASGSTCSTTDAPKESGATGPAAP